MLEKNRYWRIFLHMQESFWPFIFNQYYSSLSQIITLFICGHLSKLTSGRTSAEHAIHTYSPMFWKENLVLQEYVCVQRIFLFIWEIYYSFGNTSVLLFQWMKYLQCNPFEVKEIHIVFIYFGPLHIENNVFLNQSWNETISQHKAHVMLCGS